MLPFSRATVYSRNWSGYAVRSTTHAISGVSGTFVVPGVTSPPIGIAATWAGVGGFKTHDLIQAGVVEETQFFGRRYYAWYELLPAGVVHLHGCRSDAKCTVSKGDHMAVTVHQIGADRWHIALTDEGHWSWSKSVSYTSSRSSAEWVLESPTIGAGQAPLANVRTVHFGPTSKYTAAGKSHTAGQGHPVRIILTAEATPSALGSNGQSFNDCAYRHSCKRP